MSIFNKSEEKESVLGDYKLHYEDIKLKKLKTKKTKTPKNVKSEPKKTKKVDYKAYILSKYKQLVEMLEKLADKIYDPSKTPKKLTKAQVQEAIEQRNRAIMGIGLLFVIVSIAYSTTVIIIGVDSLESKIALLPQAIFALATLFKAFSKLYK